MQVRSIIFALYDGFFTLDLAGASAVFATAARFDPELKYRLIYASSDGGKIDAMAGPPVETSSFENTHVDATTTILVVGSEADETQSAVADQKMIDWLRTSAPVCERIGSVCTGAFLLAKAGLLANKQAATHWRACDELARLKSVGSVDPDAIFVSDGKVWTSAGVTAGIDMALAMVEADLGRDMADRIARQLVIYGRRSGHQSQFSDILDAQAKAGAPFAKLVDWIEGKLPEPIDVDAMAEVMGMSPRSFFRKFKAQTGQTPGSFLNDIRLDRARQLLVANTRVGQVATQAGFESDVGFRSAFQRRYGMSPSSYRALNAKSQTEIDS
ncbi:GlxA family transcriptional regulator [Qipengyuania sp. DGS5-3]|uniref:GlxA family transcriptional regulator n=1 Tax=Qipengyuania sp. DGS5-3 TaxID=3349632 RepID=UPI0036D36F10